jgi:hypothetical protein
MDRMRDTRYQSSERFVHNLVRTSLASAIAWTACVPADESTSQIPSPVLSQFADTMTSLGPVGWWRLGEASGAAIDASGHGNHGATTTSSRASAAWQGRSQTTAMAPS